MGNSKPNDPERVLADLRQLVRDGHALMRDYAQARKETAQQIAELRTLIADITEQTIETEVNKRIAEMHSALNKKVDQDVDTIQAEFTKLRDLLMGTSKRHQKSETHVSLREAVALVSHGLSVKETRNEMQYDPEILK